MSPCDFSAQFTKWTLKNNVFLFLGKLYRQENGTAMGVCLAPNYANPFLGLWKKEYTFSNQNPSKEKFVWWGGYVDGVMWVFFDSEKNAYGLNENLRWCI